MTHDDGGWTLVMRTKRGLNLSLGPFRYGDLAYWETSTVYNEENVFSNALDTELDFDDSHAKYPIFNEVGGETFD